jgi:putative membrane protein
MDNLSVSTREPLSNRTFFIFNAVLSVGALAFLGYLLLIRRGMAGSSVDLRFLPAVNASLNAICATLLTAGYLAIRRGARALHKYLMVSAFAASTLFLISYVAYHYVHGDTKYLGQGPMRAVYFAVLISHVLLSMGIVPLALSTLFFAWKGTFATHKKIAKIALPLWLYVSVTGVVIFFMLRGS